MAIQYQFAYDENNKIVNIFNADKNKVYHCIGCNDILIPKQGSINRWHFCHKHELVNCSNESYLHRLAKQRFYDKYTDCLLNNKPFYIEIKYKYYYSPCERNKKFNICPMCDYCRTRIERIDLTKWFKNIKVEKTVDTFRTDVCLSTPENSQHIFIEIHVSHKISENKENSKHRIIEIDINDEQDIKQFDGALLSPSNKIRFINFRIPEKTITNDNGCKKSFMLLCLAKNGGVHFMNNLNIFELNKQLSLNRDCWAKHNIIGAQPCKDYIDYNQSVDFHHCAGNHIDYKHFVATCANENLNVKSCFICRYHAESNKEWSSLPIFCKFLKKECKSTAAITCQSFKKEQKYVKTLLKYDDKKNFD